MSKRKFTVTFFRGSRVPGNGVEDVFVLQLEGKKDTIFIPRSIVGDVSKALKESSEANETWGNMEVEE